LFLASLGVHATLARVTLILPRIRPNSKPNARWRGSFSFVPGISVGFADNSEADFLAFLACITACLGFEQEKTRCG